MRKTVVCAAIVVTALVPSSPALAGGYDTFFDQRRYFRPGETVTLSEEVYVQNAEKVLEGGPYKAFLMPDSYRWWRGARPDNRLLLGTVKPAPTAHDRWVEANLTFTVPRRVRPGHYLLHVCGTPSCRTLGALGATELGIAATPVEARLLRQIDRLDTRLDGVEFQTRHGQLRRDLSEVIQPVRELVFAQEDDTSATFARLEERVERLQHRVAATERSPWYESPWSLWAGAALLALLAGLGASFAARSREGPGVRDEAAELVQVSAPRAS